MRTFSKLFLLFAVVLAPIVLIGLLVLAGLLILGRVQLLIIVLLIVIIALAVNGLVLFLYLFSDRIILKWYHARELQDTNSPLRELVRRLAAQLNIPVPRVFVVDSPLPNAFAVGRDEHHASLVIATGLRATLAEDEQEAVIAYALAQVKQGETFVGTLAAVVAGVLTSLAAIAFWCSIFTGFGQEDDPAPNLIRGFVASIVAPVAALLIQLITAQDRVYRADRASAQLLGDPALLIRALDKLEARLQAANIAVNPAHVHLFFLNPLHGDEITVMDFRFPTYNCFFRTHPATQRRIDALLHRDAVSGGATAGAASKEASG
jgi:heat shock protein HtpX